MRNVSLMRILSATVFLIFITATAVAQDKPAEPAKKMEKHQCSEKCKTDGCSADKTKNANAEHKCTDECHEIGCAVVDAKAAKMMDSKHVCSDKCKTEGCTAAKVKKASYECPMKCGPASSKEGKCSHCGMELKKKA